MSAEIGRKILPGRGATGSHRAVGRARRSAEAGGRRIWGCGKYSGAVGMVMAVTFKRYGRLYYLDPGEHRPQVGDKVLVPTDDGPEVAECVWAPQ